MFISNKAMLVFEISNSFVWCSTVYASESFKCIVELFFYKIVYSILNSRTEFQLTIFAFDKEF